MRAMMEFWKTDCKVQLKKPAWQQDCNTDVKTVNTTFFPVQLSIIYTVHRVLIAMESILSARVNYRKFIINFLVNSKLNHYAEI